MTDPVLTRFASSSPRFFTASKGTAGTPVTWLWRWQQQQGRRRRRGQRHCRACVGSRLRSGIGRRRQVVAAATGARATASGVEAGRVGGDEGGSSDAPRMGSTEAASSRSRGCCWRNSDAVSGNGNSRPSGARLLRVTGRADAERDQQRRYRDFRGAKQW